MKVAGSCFSVSLGFGTSAGFFAVSFGRVTFLGSAGFVSAGFGLTSAGFDSAGFGFTSAGFDSAGFGFTSAGFSSICEDNLVSFASNSAIFASRSFFVGFLAATIQ